MSTIKKFSLSYFSLLGTVVFYINIQDNKLLRSPKPEKIINGMIRILMAQKLTTIAIKEVQASKSPLVFKT
jgi:hypothetical protein